MTNEQKQQVKNALVRYALSFPTQTEAAANLTGVSAGTISQIRNNNWDLVSDNMWQHVARQVGYYVATWAAADTSTYMLLRILLGDAQNYCMTYGIAIAKGLGKTFSATRFRQEHENVCYFSCNEVLSRRTFITALLHIEGLDATGSTIELMEKFVKHITNKSAPIIILDDADKLKDIVMHFAVTISNKLAGKAGVILLGGKELRTKILDGVRLKKEGFDEIYKTIGRRFVTLDECSAKDIELVCSANGVHDLDLVKFIITECKGNLHVATRLIQQSTLQKIAA